MFFISVCWQLSHLFHLQLFVSLSCTTNPCTPRFTSSWQFHFSGDLVDIDFVFDLLVFISCFCILVSNLPQLPKENSHRVIEAVETINFVCFQNEAQTVPGCTSLVWQFTWKLTSYADITWKSSWISWWSRILNSRLTVLDFVKNVFSYKGDAAGTISDVDWKMSHSQRTHRNEISVKMAQLHIPGQ